MISCWDGVQVNTLTVLVFCFLQILLLSFLVWYELYIRTRKEWAKSQLKKIRIANQNWFHWWDSFDGTSMKSIKWKQKMWLIVTLKEGLPIVWTFIYIHIKILHGPLISYIISNIGRERFREYLTRLHDKQFVYLSFEATKTIKSSSCNAKK